MLICPMALPLTSDTEGMPVAGTIVDGQVDHQGKMGNTTLLGVQNCDISVFSLRTDIFSDTFIFCTFSSLVFVGSPLMCPKLFLVVIFRGALPKKNFPPILRHFQAFFL